jgi:hypothetical protein
LQRAEACHRLPRTAYQAFPGSRMQRALLVNGIVAAAHANSDSHCCIDDLLSRRPIGSTAYRVDERHVRRSAPRRTASKLR